MRKKVLGTLLLTGALLVWLALPASADGTKEWAGNGSEWLEDCGEGGTIHWVFAPLGGTATSATLTVNGEILSMEKMSANASGNAARHAWSTYDGVSVTASVTWVGTATRGNLVISDCEPYPPNTSTTGIDSTGTSQSRPMTQVGVPLGILLLVALAGILAVRPISRRIASRVTK